MKELRVDLGARSYPISFERIAAEKRDCLLVMDSNVEHFYGTQLRQRFAGAPVFVFPAGESSKNSETLLALCGFAAEHHLDRHCCFIAAGGGVTGDLTGFAASIYLRGVDFMQLPTTLLAMVDSAVGGKTAVDLPAGKNLIGTFHQPCAVEIDIAWLATLPARELANGWCEIIKTAVILDAGLFARLEEPWSDADYPQVIRRCCELKAQVVAADETERGLRAILNYGHTFGHALEHLSGYSSSHGEAVAVGMTAAGWLACELGLWSSGDFARQTELLRKFALPVTMPRRYAVPQLLELMKSDKKNSGGRIVLVLPGGGIGHASVRRDVDVELIRRAWEAVYA